jgi:predicted O-methyltransferase YrrM
MDVIRSLLKNIQNASVVETGTIRSYNEKHESTRILGESTTGQVISIDNSEDSIRISKDICKNLKNISWILGDSIDVLKSLPKTSYDFILLDSMNDKNHIYAEFLIAIHLIKVDGTIMIDDFGVSSNGSIPDKTQRSAEKGVKVYQEIVDRDLTKYLTLHQSKKGVQGIIKIDENFKSKF